MWEYHSLHWYDSGKRNVSGLSTIAQLYGKFRFGVGHGLGHAHLLAAWFIPYPNLRKIKPLIDGSRWQPAQSACQTLPDVLPEERET